MIYRTQDWRGLQPGERIYWQRDHVCARHRAGRVLSHMTGGHGLRAQPDDRNPGPEPGGGCSEVRYEDILGRDLA